jgi:hypothetical protein
MKGGNLMTLKEHIVKELEKLDEKQLHEVVEFVIFLKFRSRIVPPVNLDEEQVSNLYAEFAEEDRMLTEEGLADYTNGLSKEDKQ